MTPSERRRDGNEPRYFVPITRFNEKSQIRMGTCLQPDTAAHLQLCLHNATETRLHNAFVTFDPELNNAVVGFLKSRPTLSQQNK